MTEEKLSEQVKILEDGYVKHTADSNFLYNKAIANFGPNATVYPGIVSEGDNVQHMYDLILRFMHEEIRDRDSKLSNTLQWLSFTKRFIPEEYHDAIEEIDKVINQQSK